MQLSYHLLNTCTFYIEITLSLFCTKSGSSMFMRDTRIIQIINKQQAALVRCVNVQKESIYSIHLMYNAMQSTVMNGLFLVTFPCSFSLRYNVLVHVLILSFQCNKLYQVVFFKIIIIEAKYNFISNCQIVLQ